MAKCENCYHCEICKKYAIKSGVPESLPFMQQLRKSKLAKKPNVNVTEAKKLHEEMIGFHEYFKTKED